MIDGDDEGLDDYADAVAAPDTPVGDEEADVLGVSGESAPDPLRPLHSWPTTGARDRLDVDTGVVTHERIAAVSASASAASPLKLQQLAPVTQPLAPLSPPRAPAPPPLPQPPLVPAPPQTARPPRPGGSLRRVVSTKAPAFR